MSLKQDYKKWTHEEHVLKLPDTYIGDTDFNSIDIWAINNDPEPKMEKKTITYIPGEYKLFDETIVNALDQYIRIKEATETGIFPVKNIKINIDLEEQSICVFNDGEGIPIDIHPTEKKYIPELIFGELLTSSNYKNEDSKEILHVGGKNGYGAKLVNIFSKEFNITTVDKKKGKKFSMTFYDNKQRKDKPKITSHKSKPFTQITYKPDFTRFKSGKITDDMLTLMKRRAYDLAACTNSDVSIYFNNEKIECKNFEKYIELYLGSKTECPRVYERVNPRWEVCVALSPSLSFEDVSFVNGIHTSKGGKHVDYIINQVTKKLCEWILKKRKITIKQNYIKENLIVFIKCTIDNPSFSSQTKEYMTTNKDKFGMTCDISNKFIDQLSKCGIVERAIDLAEAKDNKSLKKNDGKKQNKIKGIPKLEDANDAGGKNSDKCTLILTEGDSAKSTAMAGLDIIGRDKYGVFPLKGKLLNVKDPGNKSKIPNNVELINIKKILGLQTDKIYKDTSTLRYGKVLILTDQDEDGSHIKGLVFNLFETLWPSLFNIPGFLNSMLTPIIKMTIGKGKKAKQIQFYSVKDYDKYIINNPNCKTNEIKYYKGLGTSTPKEAKEYFKELKMVEYTTNELQDVAALNIAFAKYDNSTHVRKEWLSNYDKDQTLDYNSPQVTIKDFINYDLIHFSNSDNIRSIPNVMDGLKPSQRKVLFSAFKRNLRTKEIKVAQFSGYTSEHSAYHHGEASLQGTIINMSQNYVGSNNIPLFMPVGQFGTRIHGGKDAAQPRYIFTKLDPITDILYNTKDFPLYKYNNDDGLPVEPKYYAPIIPMILINGTKGVGTGWSTKMPCFNPCDIISSIKSYLSDKDLKEIKPWYNGFTGKIEKINNTSYRTKGIYEIKNNKIIIKELPIGTWNQNYKEDLEKLLIDTKNKSKNQILRDYNTYCTDTKIHFELICSNEIINKLNVYDNKLDMTKLEKQLNLCTQLNISNMVLYDTNNRIKKYNSVNDIIIDYCDKRLEFYKERIEYIIKNIEDDLYLLKYKIKFINEFIDNTVKIIKTKKQAIIDQLKTKKYPEINNWDYLLKMPIYNLSEEKIEELNETINKKQKELEEIKAHTPKTLWTKELNNLLTILTKRGYSTIKINKLKNK